MRNLLHAQGLDFYLYKNCIIVTLIHFYTTFGELDLISLLPKLVIWSQKGML